MDPQFRKTEARSERALPFGMQLELHVQDQEVIDELRAFPEGAERDRFAAQALRIGIMALRQARGQVDSAVVRNEGERILEALKGQLEKHNELVNHRIATQLKEYFDPASGRFPDRIQRLIQKDGELEQVLRRQVGDENSELVKTLASHLGESSPLMKMLDPRQSEGLVAGIRELVEEQLNGQQEQILKEFSLDHKEGALHRFISELAERQKLLSGELHEKLDRAVKEFSLDDDTSALSRLVRNVSDAQRTISSEFSLDEDRSALSRLKRILESTNDAVNSQLSLDDENSALARLKREVLTLLKEDREATQKFQEEVRVVLETMQARKKEMERSTRHGVEFEDALAEFVSQECTAAGDLVERTGNRTGLIKNCKVGDVVIELNPESSAEGARIVLEAKQDANYQLVDARRELETARDNRGAQVGVFVLSQRMSGEDAEPIQRIGNDVFVSWDPEDPSTDLYLKVSLTLAKALCVRQKKARESHQADFEEIEKAILEIQKRATQLDDITTWAGTITNNGEKILGKIKTTRKSLLAQVEVLREKLEGLKGEEG